MKKAPDAFRTISEVAEILETPAHVLRFWESKFYQIKPVKRAGGRRYYRPDDVALINGIRNLLQDQGMTIRGVQRVLQESGVKHVAAMGSPLPAAPSEVADDTHQLGEAEVLDPPEADDAPQTVSAPAPVIEAAQVSSRDPLHDADPAPEHTEDVAEPATDTLPDDIMVVAMVEEIPADQASLGPNTKEPAENSMTDSATDVPPEAAAPSENITDIAARRSDQTLSAEPALESDALSDDETRQVSDRAHLARSLRRMPRGKLGNKRDQLDRLGRRIDVLLERMSEASGAGRW